MLCGSGDESRLGRPVQKHSQSLGHCCKTQVPPVHDMGNGMDRGTGENTDAFVGVALLQLTITHCNVYGNGHPYMKTGDIRSRGW